MSNVKRLIIMIAVAFSIISIGLYYMALAAMPAKMASESGVYDLSTWQGSLIELSGEWLRTGISTTGFVTIPDIWEKGSNGTGTYQATLTGLNPQKAYGVFVQDQAVAYELLANDRLVLHNGGVGEAYEPSWRPENGLMISNEEGKIYLQMVVSNYDYIDGGFWNEIILGQPADVMTYQLNRSLVDALLSIGFLLIGLALLVMYWIRPKTWFMLYFSGFTLVMSLRTALTGTRFIGRIFQGLPWDVAIRLEYMTGYLLVPLFIGFIYSLISRRQRVFLHLLFGGLTLFAVSLVALLPHKLYGLFLTPYKYLAIISVMGIIIYVIRKFQGQAFHRALLIIGVSNIVLAVIKEIIGGATSLTPIGVFNLVVILLVMSIDLVSHDVQQKYRIASEASYDTLTGLYNRKYLYDFSMEWFSTRRGGDAYILFMDLDKFKEINDAYGHDEGDLVLQEIALRLKDHLRKDDLIFRYGGDEFVFFIQSETKDQMITLVERLLELMAAPIMLNGKHHQLSASIGVVAYESHYHSIEDLIRKSDQAMYLAKKKGGDQYHLLSENQSSFSKSI